MFLTITITAIISGAISGALVYYASRNNSHFKVKHKVRGTIYEVITNATVQTEIPLVDYDRVFVYRDIETGETYARRAAEMDDGRFEIL
jgi:hypothetical protein